MTQERMPLSKNEKTVEREKYLAAIRANLNVTKGTGGLFPMVARYPKGNSRLDLPVSFGKQLDLGEGKYETRIFFVPDADALEALQADGSLEFPYHVLIVIPRRNPQ